MPTHKFKIGQTVFLTASLNVPGGAYVVTRQLPERDGEFSVKSCEMRWRGGSRRMAKSGRVLTVPNCQFLHSGPKLAWQFVRRLKFGS